MALTPIAMRRNHPNVQARDLCAAGIMNSATFKPGEKRDTSKTGRLDSLGTAQASARNPTNKPAMAGKIKRKNMRCGIRKDCIKTLITGSLDNRHLPAGG